MKHLHHIVPKHAGGTDDQSNLIELSVQEHALAHKKLWEEHGRWQDEIAWKTLSGQIGKEEAIRQSQRYGQLGKPKSISTRDKISKSLRSLTYDRKGMRGKHQSEEAKRKIGLKNSIRLTEYNPTSGSRWMTKDGIDKRIAQSEISDALSKGWILGRNQRTKLKMSKSASTRKAVYNVIRIPA